MAEKKKTPQIRFAGFDDAWEQRKLGEVFEEYSEKHHEELPALTIIQGGGTVRRDQSDRNMIYDKANLSNYKMVKKNDFIVHLRSFEGGLEIASEDGIISPAYHTFHGENTDSRFFYPFFRSSYFINVLLKPHVYGIRDGRSIDIAGMKTIKIPVPEYEEQKRLGEFIEDLDNLITLHQRKHEQLKNVKKSMLKKMFPKDGCNVPEIRFAGFTDAWEQRKLSEVVNSVDTGKSKFDKGESSGEYPILGSTSIIGYDDEYDYEGDFILTARVGANAGSLYRHVGKVKISDNTVFIQASKNIDFLYYLLTQLDIKKLSFGTGQPLVKASELRNLNLMIPTDMVEQTMIGDFFVSLDNLITLHQRKLESLQIIKKSLLQKMFV